MGRSLRPFVPLNIEKACNRVCHPGLLSNSIPEPFVFIMSRVLSNHLFYVTVYNIDFRLLYPPARVIQGSVLSPLLYLQYSADMPPPAPPIHILQNADDTAFPILQQSKLVLQEYLPQFSSWYKEWFFTIYPDQFQVIVVIRTTLSLRLHDIHLTLYDCAICLKPPSNTLVSPWIAPSPGHLILRPSNKSSYPSLSPQTTFRPDMGPRDLHHPPHLLLSRMCSKSFTTFVNKTVSVLKPCHFEQNTRPLDSHLRRRRRQEFTDCRSGTVYRLYRHDDVIYSQSEWADMVGARSRRAAGSRRGTTDARGLRGATLETAALASQRASCVPRCFLSIPRACPQSVVSVYPWSLLKWLVFNRISATSFVTEPQHVDAPAKTFVVSNCILCPFSRQCPAMADLSGWLCLIRRSCSVQHSAMVRVVCPTYMLPHSQGSSYIPGTVRATSSFNRAQHASCVGGGPRTSGVSPCSCSTRPILMLVAPQCARNGAGWTSSAEPLGVFHWW